MSVVYDREGETHTEKLNCQNDATFFFSLTIEKSCGQKAKFCVRWNAVDIRNELTNENVIFHILVYVLTIGNFLRSKLTVKLREKFNTLCHYGQIQNWMLLFGVIYISNELTMAICLHKLINRASVINPILLQCRQITTPSLIAPDQIDSKVKNNLKYYFFLSRHIWVEEKKNSITSIQYFVLF